MEIDSHQVDVRGTPVVYRTAGSGSPVVLVHGLSGSARWWLPTLPALAPDFRVYLVDLPGFGAMADRGHFDLGDAAD